MQQNHDEVKNPELVQAMETLKEHFTPENQQKVTNYLVKAHFLTPVTTSEHEINGEKKVMIVPTTIENTNGQHYYLAFTEWRELYKWNGGKEGDQAVVVSLADYVQLLDANTPFDMGGVVIDPYGSNLALPKEFVLEFKALMVQKPVEENS